MLTHGVTSLLQAGTILVDTFSNKKYTEVHFLKDKVRHQLSAYFIFNPGDPRGIT